MNERTGAARRRVDATDPRPVLVTGGAGFVGTNLAARLLSAGRPVRVMDDLSRPGVLRNLRWLESRYGSLLETRVADVRDPGSVRSAVSGTGWVVHLAAQVAVTTSLRDPVEDFETNVRGTLNVLEALRALPSPPPLLFTSTNKVYGALADLALEPRAGRWEPAPGADAAHGIDEARPLDLHTPYGCSKGSADQYVLDYARCFGLPAVVFRMSCIYGPHQCGSEDQGWVAHFLLRALRDEPITIYGDGRQVRDVLYVEDLVDAMLAARELCRGAAGGRAFNIGGGPQNAVSLREILDRIQGLHGTPLRIRWDEPRVGDQRFFVADVRAFTRATAWRPRTSPARGVARLHRWLRERESASAETAASLPLAAEAAR